MSTHNYSENFVDTQRELADVHCDGPCYFEWYLERTDAYADWVWILDSDSVNGITVIRPQG